MKLLKHIDNNLYLVDTEAENTVGYYFADNPPQILNVEKTIPNFNVGRKHKKIIAQLKDQLKGVPLFTMPEERVDVDELASGCIEKHKNEFDNWRDMAHAKVGYTMGYNRCLSDNKERKYTEVDIYNLMGSYLLYLTNKKANHTITAKQFIDNYLQSLTTKNLQQYDGKRVEIEAELNQCDGCNSNIPIVNDIHKSPYPSGSMVCQKHKYGKIIITKIV